ncbi:MAG: AAA family ATPase [Nitrospirota bacterium]|jgi:type II secretory pathway predicted ATPase ExeA
MDYLEYYGLKEHPFSNVVDNRFYYNSPQHSNALVKLRYAVDTGKGLAVVIGNIGTGKTTLARLFLEELDEDRYEAALLMVVHSTVSAEWLLRKFAMQLGVSDVKEDKVELLSQIYKRLYEIKEEGKKTVVMLDEVQMLVSMGIMEEFRGLLNMEAPEGKLVNFIFFGLPEFDNILSLDKPLRQRVAVKIRLQAFSEEDTRSYIDHRLSVAGCNNKKIFTEDALKLIFQYSKGVPRLINVVCDNALLEGYLLKTDSVDDQTTKTVAIGLDLDGAGE